MKLPNGDRAIIDRVKLTEYCLNPRHRRGKHKARVFAAALGITIKDSDKLYQALRTAAREEDAKFADSDRYGQRFVIEFQMDGPHGERRVRSMWIIRAGESEPRLASCYVV